MKLASYFAVLIAAASYCACAEEPQTPTAQPAAAQAAAAQPAAAANAAAAPGTATGTATAPAKSEKSEISAAQIKLMRGRGYKPVKQHDGTIMFCRAEGQIGTHFETTHCNTLDELNRIELNSKDYVNTIQQQGSPTPFKGP